MIGNIFKEISEAAKTTSLSELSKDIPLASTEELNMPIDKYSLPDFVNAPPKLKLVF